MATARTIDRHEMGEFLSVIRVRIRVSLRDRYPTEWGDGRLMFFIF